MLKIPDEANIPESLSKRPHGQLLVQLLNEVLGRVVDGRPLPNPWVYKTPWHRDAAMMAMVLERTGNIDLIRDWILSLSDPYDRNNKGNDEPDNLGQVLYLVSLVSDRTHPIVEKVLKEIHRFQKGNYIEGTTDYAPRPVYQTLWLKFGLAALGLEDSYSVPTVDDAYSGLFWMSGSRSGAAKFEEDILYPYLYWAEAHTFRLPAPLHLLGDRLVPDSGWQTWETKASEADYLGMAPIGQPYVDGLTAAPHSWHAAEAFLYLFDHPESAPQEGVQIH